MLSVYSVYCWQLHSLKLSFSPLLACLHYYCCLFYIGFFLKSNHISDVFQEKTSPKYIFCYSFKNNLQFCFSVFHFIRNLRWKSIFFFFLPNEQSIIWFTESTIHSLLICNMTSSMYKSPNEVWVCFSRYCSPGVFRHVCEVTVPQIIIALSQARMYVLAHSLTFFFLLILSCIFVSLIFPIKIRIKLSSSIKQLLVFWSDLYWIYN